MDHALDEMKRHPASRGVRRSIVVMANAGCLGLAACGSADTDKLTSQASDLTEKARTAAEEVKNGDVKPQVPDA